MTLAGACGNDAPEDRIRVSGHVEATEVRVAAEVGGRLLELGPREGDRVAQGDVIGQIDPRDTELALQRAQADRAQAEAQLRLVQAGARREEITQASAQYRANTCICSSGTTYTAHERLAKSNRWGSLT
jgi:HlyD family secretion protein